MVKIGSNILSLNAQKRLNDATSSLSKTYERLSSGMRINRASDDAAGLAIATSLNVDAKLFAQGSRNINDAISSINIAEGAIQAQIDIVTRMQELAEQSANGVYTGTQRQALNVEYTALIQEFGRIGATTSFNGQNLLRNGNSGTESSIAIQAGISADVNSIISVITDDSGTFSGSAAFRTEFNGNDTFTGADTTIFANLVNSVDTFYENIGGTIFHETVQGSDGQSHELYYTFATSRNGTAFDRLNLIGIEVDSDGNSKGTFVGLNIYNSSASNGALNVEISTSVNLIGATASISVDMRHLDISRISSQNAANQGSVLESTGVAFKGQAKRSLDILNSRREELNSGLGKLGAVQQRLMVANNNLASARQNYLEAAGRITNADIAYESANLVRTQILQKAAASVLTQANQQPALALRLLKS